MFWIYPVTKQVFQKGIHCERLVISLNFKNWNVFQETFILIKNFFSVCCNVLLCLALKLTYMLQLTYYIVIIFNYP